MFVLLEKAKILPFDITYELFEGWYFQYFWIKDMVQAI